MEIKDILLKLRGKVIDEWNSNHDYTPWDSSEDAFYDGKECAYENVVDLIDELMENNGEWKNKEN